VNRVPWVSTEALSPREAALNRLSAVMQAAAVLHAAALAGLLAFGLLRPEGAAWASALAGGFGSGAALFVLLGLSANIGAALLLYADIGRVVRRRGCNAVDGRAVVSRGRKLALVLRALGTVLSTQREPSVDDPPALPEVGFLIEAVAGARALPGGLS